MDHADPLDEEKTARAKWNFRALSEEALRATAARRIELTPEESAALGEVFAERQLSRVPPEKLPEYRGFGGFVRRHFRGDYPLGQSYWLHFFLLSALASGFISAMLGGLRESGRAWQLSVAVLGAVALTLLIWAWGAIGTWASASKHERRGGRGIWAGLAKVVIAFGVLGQGGQVVRMLPFLGEHVRVALGEQPGDPVQLVVRADGRSLLVRGGINEDTAEMLERALGQAPGVRVVVLESAGGWVRQGQEIAAVISKRGLDTYVESECSSACTIAFLAGRDRAADPDARLGFHSFRGVGMSRGGAVEREQDIYGAAGLANGFIQAVRSTPPERLWYPDHSQLLRERVLTRLSQGGETAAIATQASRRDDIAGMLLKSPLHQALKDAQPVHFQRLVDATWSAVQRRQTDREVVAAARLGLGAAADELLPGADDAALEAFFALRLDQATALGHRAPQACADLIFRSRLLHPSAAAPLPQPLRDREADVMRAVFASSSPGNVRQADDAAVRPLIDRALAAMKPQSARVITTLRTVKHDPARTCLAGQELMEAVLAMPSPLRAKAIRALSS